MSGSSLAVEASPPSTPSGLIDPVPLSMPSILVNAKPTNSASHTLANRAINKPPPSSSSSSSHRHIGRRKLLRRVNSIPSSHNPHAVSRPRASDYLPSHAGQERYRGTFPSPTPRYLREVGKQGEIRDARQARDLRVEWEKGVEDEAMRRRREQAAAAGGGELKPGDRGLEQAAAAPPDSGLFTMSIQEARFFLTRRAGVVVSRGQRRRDEAEAPPPESTPMQHLVDCLEAELLAWSDQLVYRPGAHDIGGSSTGFNPHPTILVEANSFESPTSSHVARVEEHHRLPQSLVLCIPDAFDRLTVHCLARVWGMRSFSKPAQGKGEETKLTWILKPPPSKAQRQMQRRQQQQRASPFEQLSASSSAVDAAAAPTGSAGVFSRSQGGLETPPTTDVGTSASELGDSSDDDDGWSLAGEDTVQPYDTSADVSGATQGDVTLGVVDEEEEEGEQTTAAAAGLADRLAGASLLDEHDGYVRSDESAPASDDDYAADDDDLAESGTLTSPLSTRGVQGSQR